MERLGTTVGISNLMHELRKWINALEDRDVERIIITRHNKPIAVMLTVEEYDQLKENVM